MNLQIMKERSDEVSTIMKHLGHPKKLLVLCSLAESKKSVGELTEMCEVGQSQMSHFLKRMELEKLLGSERDGNHIYYFINDLRIKKMIKQLKNIFCS